MGAAYAEGESNTFRNVRIVNDRFDVSHYVVTGFGRPRVLPLPGGGSNWN